MDRLRAELEAGRYALPALLAAMACAAIYLLIFTRRTGFYLDEWNFIYDRLDFSVHDVLRPYTDNLTAIPLLVYQAAIKAFGLGEAHLPIRLLWVATVLTCSLLLFVYLRRRTLAWFALLPACLLLFFGEAWTYTATTIGLVGLGSVAAGLGALVALDRRSDRGDLCAGALLVLGLAWHSAALPFVLGAAVTVALRGRPAAWRQAWIWAVPLAFYLVWLVWARATYTGSPLDLGNLTKAPGALYDGVSTDFAAIFGRYVADGAGRIYRLELGPGHVAAVLLAVWLAVVAIRRRFPREVLVGLVMLLAYWLIVALAISPARQPTADRYQYVGALLLVITIAPLAPRRSPPLLAWAAIAAVFVLISLAPNIRDLSQSTQNVETASDESRAGLTALEMSRASVAGDFEPTSAVPEFQGSLYLPPSAGSYFATVDRHGSPALSEAELLNRREEVRRIADAVLASALGLHLRAESVRAGATAIGCRRRSIGPDGLVAVEPGREMLITPEGSRGAEVVAARFADHPTVRLGRVGDGDEAVLSIPPDRATRPWRLRVAGGRIVRVCAG